MNHTLTTLQLHDFRITVKRPSAAFVLGPDIEIRTHLERVLANNPLSDPADFVNYFRRDLGGSIRCVLRFEFADGSGAEAEV